MHCSHCGCKHLLRMKRAGLLEEKVLPLLGFYPWKCTDCRARMLLRSRGKRTKVAAVTPQVSSQR